MKFLIDEDISPICARYLCRELSVDAIAVRDRGLLGVEDRKILEYAFNEDRILITANIKDFKLFANTVEVHSGIVFIMEGSLLKHEQIELVEKAVKIIQAEIFKSKDMVNRVLYVSIDGTKRFENLPSI